MKKIIKELYYVNRKKEIYFCKSCNKGNGYKLTKNTEELNLSNLNLPILYPEKITIFDKTVHFVINEQDYYLCSKNYFYEITESIYLRKGKKFYENLLDINPIWTVDTIKEYLESIKFYNIVGNVLEFSNYLNDLNYKKNIYLDILPSDNHNENNSFKAKTKLASNDKSMLIKKLNECKNTISELENISGECETKVKSSVRLLPQKSTREKINKKKIVSKLDDIIENIKKILVDLNEVITQLIDGEKEENYYNESLDNFIKLLNDYSSKNFSGPNFFRGVGDCIYKEIPGVLRGNRLKNEDAAYREFKLKFTKELHNLNLIETLTEMQHYELPTRLLDITSNPLVGLYMACNKIYTGDPFQVRYGEVIIYFPRKNDVLYFDSDKVQMLSALPLLSEKEKDELLYSNIPSETPPSLVKLLDFLKRMNLGFENRIEKGDLKKTFIVKVGMINDRILAQSGAFIISGLGDENLVEKSFLSTRNYELGFPRIIIKNKKKIYDELLSLDISDSKMFPDMDHTANYIKETILDGEN